jgi:hypothetical protein
VLLAVYRHAAWAVGQVVRSERGASELTM